MGKLSLASFACLFTVSLAAYAIADETSQTVPDQSAPGTGEGHHDPDGNEPPSPSCRPASERVAANERFLSGIPIAAESPRLTRPMRFPSGKHGSQAGRSLATPTCT